MFFRKKPVVVEAVTFEEFVEYGRNSEGANIVDGLPWSFNYKGHPITHENDKCYLIPTLEGLMRFTPEDVLITGVKGEIYPCKIDIFNATYEVEEKCIAKEINVSPNPIVETKQFRVSLDAILQQLKASERTSQERSIAITKVQEAIMWLGMDLKALNEPNPYPNSYNPSNTIIEPTADGLQL